MNSLRDRVYPVTRSSNASECDVTFERYCINSLEGGHTHTCTYAYRPTFIDRSNYKKPGMRQPAAAQYRADLRPCNDY